MFTYLGWYSIGIIQSEIIYSSQKKHYSINNELKFDSVILGFEINVQYAGILKIDALYFDFCDEGVFGSKNFIDSYNLSNYRNLSSESYNVGAGYNKIFPKKAINLKKGTIFSIEIIAHSYLGIDSKCDSIYSDFYELSGMLYKIDKIKNCRLLFNVLTEQFYYESINFFNHTFDQIGTYYFTINSLNETKFDSNYTFDITSKSSIGIICPKETKFFSTINCSIIAVTTEKSDLFAIIESNKSTIFNHASDLRSFFGNNFSMLNLNIQKQSDLNGYFILPSTEFEFDSFLLGFEFLASSKIAQIRIFVNIFSYLILEPEVKLGHYKKVL
ncbi:unnamed protein product [Brachionus calyciflorus]|uniref:Uncharacterized protein n=1 Tax=Brachionus calyciflorus TaxID=104777 RepID=A0A814G852_9BILA|nr:unnamed protein product [Brachionus calyciflorus]